MGFFVVLIGLRGVSAAGIILEEAAFMNDQLFYRVVVPLMSVNNTAVIAISSPDDEFNYFSKLMNLKRDAKNNIPLFLVIQITQACEACQKAGKRCPHNEALLPPWRSAKRQELTEQIMKSNPMLFEREMLGLMKSSDSLFVFDPVLVDAFHHRPCYRFSLFPKLVWVAIDPSGGGSLSNYAILSMAFQRQHSIVLGLDHTNSFVDAEIMEMVRFHLRSIRRNPIYEGALIVVFIEAQADYVHANRLSVEFSAPEFQPIMFESKDPADKGRVGVRSGPAEKYLYVQQLTQVLQDQKLVWADPMLPFYREDMRYGDRKTQLIEQIKRYRRVVSTPDDAAFGKFKETYTGKSSGEKDDLCMALQICLHYSWCKRIDPVFRDLCHRRGLLLD